MPNTDEQGAQILVRRLSRTLGEADVAASIGVATLRGGHSAEELRAEGDAALTRPDPSYDLSGPAEAFDIAEQIGCVHELDELCATQALTSASDLPAAQRPRSVLMAMATFARQTGAFVIAEGMEDEETLEFLRGVEALDAQPGTIIQEARASSWAARHHRCRRGSQRRFVARGLRSRHKRPGDPRRRS